MTGDVWDYNKSRIYIGSGEKRIIIPFKDYDEYYHWLKSGMRIGKSVDFDYEYGKLIKFY